METRFKKKVDEAAEDRQKGEFVVEISVPRERIASCRTRHKHSRHLSMCSANECMCGFERPGLEITVLVKCSAGLETVLAIGCVRFIMKLYLELRKK